MKENINLNQIIQDMTLMIDTLKSELDSNEHIVGKQNLAELTNKL